MLRLHFVDNRQPPVWLADERYTLGSDVRNTLRLDGVGIAPFHAEVRQESGFYYLTDLGSHDGTFVNGEKVGARYQLRSGDRLRLGALELELVDPARARTKPAGPQRWLLQVVQGEHEGRLYHVTGSMTFGRSVKCELCFSDPELSRRHAEFFLKDDVLEVKDLASSNGVQVNRQKVSTAVLQPGDQVQLGSVTLLVIGPKVAVPEALDEDATLFIPAAQLPPPKAERPRATPNPLRAAALAAAATSPTETPVASKALPRLGLLLAGLMVVAALVMLGQLL